VTTTSIDEPTPASDRAPGVGSSSSAPPVGAGRDLLRALCCALLVGLSVASPSSAILFAPFVPVLVAIRLLRQRAGRQRFVATATAASLLAAILAGLDESGDVAKALVGAAAALLLVPALGLVHARAARHDPIESATILEWPEPRLRTGLTPTILGWTVALLVVTALAAPFVDSLAATSQDALREASASYDELCADDGALADRDEYCADLLDRRDRAVEVLGDHAPEVLAAFLAVFAFGAAATAHLVVLARARRVSDRVRRSWRLRELELHWASAYVLAAGLVAVMVAGDGAGSAVVALRAVGIGLSTLGALAVFSQGIGLVAWVFSRGGSPTWYRVALGLFALFVLPVTIALVFTLGVLDLALHPRRRAAARTPRA
jgi:hypothetical protein